MTWYCPEWTSNIERDDIEENPGQDSESVYLRNRCNQFDVSTTETVDAHGRRYDYYDVTSDATCSAHDEIAMRLDDPIDCNQINEDIDGTTDIWACSACSLVFNEEAYNEHLAEIHDIEDERAERSPTTHNTWQKA